MVEYILERPTKVGYPVPFGGMTNIMQNPKYSTVLGLLLEDAVNNRRTDVKQSFNDQKDSDLMGRLGDSLRSVFKEIF